MSSSHTHNVETWTHGWSTTLLSRFQLSVSLDERITVMEVFTCTLSLISGNELTYETIDDSMLTAATRTLHHAVAHRKRCSTMQSRTEMLLREDSTPDSTFQLRRLIQSGIELRMQRLLTSFGQLFELAPRALLCNHQSLRAYADWHYRPVATKYEHPPGLQLRTDHMPELDEWVRDNLSGSGKSCPSHLLPPPHTGGGSRGPLPLPLVACSRAVLPQSNFDRWTS